VLGDIPSLREVWGDAALYADPSDDRALRDALGRLIDDEHERRDLAERARRRAERYGSDRMASDYLRLYERLAVRAPDGATA
jgi:glycosyltransferase involved in cell wall biosynthesis